jgi:hypothetical protein
MEKMEDEVRMKAAYERSFCSTGNRMVTGIILVTYSPFSPAFLSWSKYSFQSEGGNRLSSRCKEEISSVLLSDCDGVSCRKRSENCSISAWSKRSVGKETCQVMGIRGWGGMSVECDPSRGVHLRRWIERDMRGEEQIRQLQGVHSTFHGE